MKQKEYTEKDIETIIEFVLNEDIDESLRKEVYHNVFVLNEFEHTPDWEGDWERTKARLQRFKDRFGKAADVTKKFFKGWGEYIDKAKAKKEGRPYEPTTPEKPTEPTASTPVKSNETPATPSKPTEKPPETLKQKVEKRKADLEAAKKRAEERKTVWKKDSSVKPSEKPAVTPVPSKPAEPVKPKEEPNPTVPPVTPPVTKKEAPSTDAARPAPVTPTPTPVTPKAKPSDIHKDIADLSKQDPDVAAASRALSGIKKSPVSTTTPKWSDVTSKFDRTTDLLKQASAKLDKLKR